MDTSSALFARVARLRDRPALPQPMPMAPTMFQPQDKLHDITATAKIRCPACYWQPEKRSRWFCGPMGPPENFNGGCGHSWNTFDTGGRCPGCKHQWAHTTCLRCTSTSKHVDWYDAGSAPATPPP